MRIDSADLFKKSVQLSAVATIGLMIASCETAPKAPAPKSTEESISFSTQAKKEIILDHKYFKVVYDEENRLPKYVEYTLTKRDLKGPGDRTGLKFKPDPLLKVYGIQAVKDDDYTNSGYARGHMAPAEDFIRSQEAVVATFITTNAVPQIGRFNGGPWAQLEKKVRGWACGEEKIRVITGPMLDNSLLKMKKTISIPKRIFKVVFDETSPKKVIGFIYSQSDVKGILPSERVVSIEALEKEIGYRLPQFKTSEKGNESYYHLSDISEWKTGICKK